LCPDFEPFAQIGEQRKDAIEIEAAGPHLRRQQQIFAHVETGENAALLRTEGNAGAGDGVRGMPASSRPSKRTEPRRRSTMPMIAFSVVVLPTPLRPSSVTTSPGCTSKVTPCRMCDSPYQASSPLTASMARAPAACFSIMAGPEIGFAHRWIGRHGRIVALGEHLAAGEHGNAIAQIGDHAEIMLDHQHGARGATDLISALMRAISSWPMPAIGSSSSSIVGSSASVVAISSARLWP
jgi:hypothetical protein